MNELFIREKRGRCGHEKASYVAVVRERMNEKEIQRAQAILSETQHHDVHFAKIVFWTAMVVVIFANLMVSLVLIPFIVVFQSWALYLVVVLLAGSIGFLYNYLITYIFHLERHHHVLASIIIPIIALANMLITVTISNRFIMELKIPNAAHNPWMVSIVFMAAFILPFVFDQMKRAYHTRKAVVVR